MEFERKIMQEKGRKFKTVEEKGRKGKIEELVIIRRKSRQKGKNFQMVTKNGNNSN